MRCAVVKMINFSRLHACVKFDYSPTDIVESFTGMKCTNDTCENVVPYFGDFSSDISLSMSFLALCLTPILYFGVLYILEYKVVEQFIAKRSAGIPDNTDATFEEQVKTVKREIAYEVSKLGSK